MKLYGYTFDFNKELVKVDYIYLRSNDDYYKFIMIILNKSGYRFSPLRSMPAFLKNYRDVKRNILILCLKGLVSQLSAGLEVNSTVPYLVGFNGFELKSLTEDKCYRVNVCEVFKKDNTLLSRNFVLTHQLPLYIESLLLRGYVVKIS